MICKDEVSSRNVGNTFLKKRTGFIVSVTKDKATFKLSAFAIDIVFETLLLMHSNNNA